jgi:hypothetical protein
MTYTPESLIDLTLRPYPSRYLASHNNMPVQEVGCTEPVYLASDDAVSGGAPSGGTRVRLRRVGVRSSARRVTDVGVVGAPPPVGVLGALPAPVGVVEPCCIQITRR